MRLIIGLMLAALASLPSVASGEWVLIGGRNDGSFKIYANSEVKVLPTGLIEAWEVWDYREPQADSALKITYRSRLWQQSINCRDQTAAALALFFYSDAMAKGDKLHSVDRPPQKVKYLRGAPGTPGEQLIKKVCEWAG